MTVLQSHPHLTLAEHLGQIREAAGAIWRRHGVTFRSVCADACRWFDDAVTWHDAGKASAAFQRYILNPPAYRGGRLSKAHTPLSTALALRHAESESWDWRRALVIALVAAGHHSEFKTLQELDDAFCCMDGVIDQQLRNLDWDALSRAIAVTVAPTTESGADLCVARSDYLSELVEQLHALPADDAVAFRLLCQLTFSVLLEADKAFLAVRPADVSRYLTERHAVLPPRLVNTLLAKKTKTPLDLLRTEARAALLVGMECAADRRVQTMTLPTGTGKTLLAATWALTLREKLTREEGQPPLVLVVLPFLAVIDQTAEEYERVFRGHADPGELISFHSLADRTYAPDLEDESQDFFLDSWRSDVVITTFDQLLFALLSPKARHQMRFHHLADALIVLDEVQALPCILWDPVRKALNALTRMGCTHVLAMSATQPGFLSDPHELIPSPGAFFERVSRYRLLLRHRSPMQLATFIQECRGRATDWAGQRVLLTLNTRRSARQVRDAIAEAVSAGTRVEFLTADVTPRDRLAAVERVKAGGPCIVVSTQCIEAGVDLDMNVVVRDFAPLDSLIQVAGRCNRHAIRPRGTVEIVSLLDDEHARAFAAMIYDRIKLQVTQQILADREEIPEEDVFPLTVDYFRALAAEKDTGEQETARWSRWEEPSGTVRELLRGSNRPRWQFLALDGDPSLRDDLEAAQRIKDRWDRRRAVRRLARRLAENTVSVYQSDNLVPGDHADPFPPSAGRDEAWFWLLHPGRYGPDRGLDLGARGEEEPWGILI
jgi:CRISPR-associated endonuclease/helicase Cas3